MSDDDREDAWEADECLLCVPAPHPNCEKHGVLEVLDRQDVPLGEDVIDHTVPIPVCLEHYQTIQAFQGGNNVGEIDIQ